jgi:hypothetical protein
LFAVREDPTGGALDDGRVRMVRVGPDGSVQAEPVAVDWLGAGAPSLIFDRRPRGGAPHGWLALASGSGSLLLAGLSSSGSPLEPARSDPELGVSGVLAAHEGRLLLVSPHGRDAVLRWTTCLVTPPEQLDAAAPRTSH